jgi:microcystin-dependent protein
MPTIENLNSNVKPGTVMAFPVDSIPDGWLICNGAWYPKLGYYNLYQALKKNRTSSPYGETSDGFYVPDFQGKFLRGVGGNAAGIGVTQGDAIKNIYGKMFTLNPGHSNQPSGVFTQSVVDDSAIESGDEYGTSMATFDASTVVPTANENRPINMAVVYCIKY